MRQPDALFFLRGIDDTEHEDISTSHDCIVEGCDMRLLLSRLVRAPLPAIAAPVVSLCAQLIRIAGSTHGI